MPGSMKITEDMVKRGADAFFSLESRSDDRIRAAIRAVLAVVPDIDEAVRDAVLKEREACAKLCERTWGAYHEPTDWDYGAQDGCTKCAAAIRARGNDG